MKLKLFCIFYFTVCVLIAADYYNKPKTLIPSEHLYLFNEQELKKILKTHLLSLGTNVPDGKLEIKGLETHYVPENKGNLGLLIKEKHE